MGFKESLTEKLKEVLKPEEMQILPSGFQTLGKAIVIKLNPKLSSKKQLIGKACVEILPLVKSVYANLGKIEGTFRTPEKMELVGGVDDPIVEFKENGVIYRFDLTKIMFSKGNVNERRFLATLVQDGEIVVDMFAGIGYFSLPIAKHSKAKQIYSIELNPYSYKFLLENIKLNKLEHRITPILGDSKIEVVKLAQAGVKADRVVMGVFPAPKEFVKEALTLGKDTGTIYHYEGVVERDKYEQLFEEFKKIADVENISCKMESYRAVKSYGPNLYHYVIDIAVSKN